MKLNQLYLIGIFIVITVLGASAFWQYQQFQNTVQKLPSVFSQNISENMPNINQQYGQLLNQMQNQMQNQKTLANSTSTKNYTAPDNSFSFLYPADWQKSNIQMETPVNERSLFSAYNVKTDALSSATNYLTVEESIATSSEAIINKYKNDERAKNTAIKITESEIVNNDQTIKVIETKSGANNPITGITLMTTTSNALIEIGDKIYIVSVVTQNNGSNISTEADQIFGSIKINAATSNAPISIDATQ